MGNTGEQLGILSQYPGGCSLPVGHGVQEARNPLALIGVSLGVWEAASLCVEPGNPGSWVVSSNSLRDLHLRCLDERGEELWALDFLLREGATVTESLRVRSRLAGGSSVEGS
jgi:hypothetical protein